VNVRHAICLIRLNNDTLCHLSDIHQFLYKVTTPTCTDFEFTTKNCIVAQNIPTMDSFQAYTSTETRHAQPDQTQKSTPSSPSKPPASLKPSNLSVYAQQHRGLWQPTTPSIFVVMMSTFQKTNRSLPNETVTPLAHFPTLDDAREALQAFARQHCVAGVTEDIDLGHYFKVSGAGKTRTFWVKEVGHARVLKMMDFDELDGGLGGERAGDFGT
jgi:hypothetical protein